MVGKYGSVMGCSSIGLGLRISVDSSGRGISGNVFADLHL